MGIYMYIERRCGRPPKVVGGLNCLAAAIFALTTVYGNAEESNPPPVVFRPLIAVYTTQEITVQQLMDVCANGKGRDGDPEGIAVVHRQSESFCSGFVAGLALSANPNESQSVGTSIQCSHPLNPSALKSAFIAEYGRNQESREEKAAQFILENILGCR